MSAITHSAVLRQLQSMQASSFDIAIRHENGPFNESRGRTLAECTSPRFIAWLARENSLGGHIYVKPTPGATFRHLLLDDLKPDSVSRIRSDSIPLACLVQTSPGNYQAWLRFPEPLQSDEARGVARLLAQRYDADPACVAKSHYGRLAGFTNRKEKYRRVDGRFPWVYLSAAPQKMLSKELQAQLVAEARAQDLITPEVSRPIPVSVAEPTPAKLTDAGQIYSRVRSYKIARGTSNESAIDLAFCLVALNEKIPDGEIIAALRHFSPGLEQRKHGHVEDYLARTLDKARQYQNQVVHIDRSR